MDKKLNRSVQALAKGGCSGTESKKDVCSKSWPRGSRRREPSGANVPSKSDGTRTKPLPQQRSRFGDKRPKPRGCTGHNTNDYVQSTSADGGKEDTGLTHYYDGTAELGSVFVPGSKKQSLNHLLNFHYTPRGERNEHWGGFLQRNGQNSSRWLSTQKHKYNKEQFLQANCQFVVNSSGDYKLYMNNPDALVDWDLIEQIHVQVIDVPSCPICLYPPVAAKMTRCGHIYCWSCVLHYLSLSDKAGRKCPICYEAVHKTDLKSVVAVAHAAFNVNEFLTLRLMKRAQGSLTAAPVDEMKTNRNYDTILNMSETSLNTTYSKLLLATPTDIMSIISRERNELMIHRSENEEEKCFIDEAIILLDEREKSVDCFSIQENDDDNKNRTRFESVNSESLESNEDFSLNNVVDEESISDNTKYYYFYQAADGQHIYLHALNIRMLEHTYGALEHCPVTLNGRILEKENGSMTEELRKRLRALQHLPVTCQFEVAEIQLQGPVVSKETLDHFQEQIDARKKSRQRRSREEKRREKRIREEENRRMGRFPEVNMHIESLHQFPGFSAEDPIVGASCATDLLSVPIEERCTSPSLAGCSPQAEQYSGPSFAKMLSSGKKTVNRFGLPSSSKSEINVPKITNTSDSEPELDGYVPAPIYSQSFSDAIALALEKASISEKELNESGSTSGSKRKKKNKQKVLFATSMVYSGK